MQGLINSLPGAVCQGLIWGILAIGLYITNKILDISDLTVDGSICTGASVCAVMLVGGVDPYIATLCAIPAGMLAGLITGILHTVFNIPAILAGILTQQMLWTINLRIMDTPFLSVPTRFIPVLVRSSDEESSVVVLSIIALMVIAVLYWFFGTAFGCSIRATGCNINMSRAQGINTNFNKVFGLVISNGIIALAGALLCQYNGASDVTMGRGAIVIGLAAIIIGEVLFSKIARNFAVRLICVALGSVIYYLIMQVVTFGKIDSDDFKLISALIVAIFLAVPTIKEKLSKCFKPRKTKAEVEENA